MTDLDIFDLRQRLLAAGDPEAAGAVDGLALALAALAELAADESLPMSVRRKVAGALYCVRWSKTPAKPDEPTTPK